MVILYLSAKLVFFLDICKKSCTFAGGMRKNTYIFVFLSLLMPMLAGVLLVGSSNHRLTTPFQEIA